METATSARSIFIVGPLVGALAAALGYRALVLDRRPPATPAKEIPHD